MDRPSPKRAYAKLLLVVIIASGCAAIAAAMAQRLITGEINPPVTGAIAGAIGAVAAVSTMRSKKR